MRPKPPRLEFQEGDFGFGKELPTMMVSKPIMYSLMNHNKIRFIESHGYRLVYFSKSLVTKIDSLIPEQQIEIPELVKKTKQIFRMLLRMNNIKDFIERKNKRFQVISIRYEKDSFVLYFMEFRYYKNLQEKSKLNFIIEANEISETPQFNPFSRAIPVKLKTEIFQRDNYTCQYCGWKNGIKEKPDRILTLDHQIPIAYGGTTKKENLITCCLKCNIKKNDRLTNQLIKITLEDEPIQKKTQA